MSNKGNLTSKADGLGLATFLMQLKKDVFQFQRIFKTKFNANFTNYRSQTMGKGEVRLIDVLNKNRKQKSLGTRRNKRKRMKKCMCVTVKRTNLISVHFRLPPKNDCKN